MKQQEKIHLAFACGERFEKMPLHGEGRLCASCNTVVIDFTAMSLEEIQSYFEERKSERVCGRYRTLHTDAPLEKEERIFLERQERISSKKLWRPVKYAVLLLLTLSFLAGGCRSRKPAPSRLGGKRVFDQP